MGIELVMVFDGAPVPCKKLTEDDRNQSRLENLRKAIEIERTGNIREAEKFYTRAVDVTPAIAKEIMDELKKYNIECIVAPYEADAQLAYLCRIGYIDGVISEDSDLIVFGSTKILYKLEHNGNVQEFLFENLWKHPNYNMTKWTHDQFIMMCVLAGCDYLKSFKNFGLKSAYKIISQSTDIKQIIFRLKKIVGKVPENYENLFFDSSKLF